MITLGHNGDTDGSLLKINTDIHIDNSTFNKLEKLFAIENDESAISVGSVKDELISIIDSAIDYALGIDVNPKLLEKLNGDFENAYKFINILRRIDPALADQKLSIIKRPQFSPGMLHTGLLNKSVDPEIVENLLDEFGSLELYKNIRVDLAQLAKRLALVVSVTRAGISARTPEDQELESSDIKSYKLIDLRKDAEMFVEWAKNRAKFLLGKLPESPSLNDSDLKSGLLSIEHWQTLRNVYGAQFIKRKFIDQLNLGDIELNNINITNKFIDWLNKLQTELFSGAFIEVKYSKSRDGSLIVTKTIDIGNEIVNESSRTLSVTNVNEFVAKDITRLRGDGYKLMHKFDEQSNTAVHIAYKLNLALGQHNKLIKFIVNRLSDKINKQIAEKFSNLNVDMSNRLFDQMPAQTAQSNNLLHSGSTDKVMLSTISIPIDDYLNELFGKIDMTLNTRKINLKRKKGSITFNYSTKFPQFTAFYRLKILDTIQLLYNKNRPTSKIMLLADGNIEVTGKISTKQTLAKRYANAKRSLDDPSEVEESFSQFGMIND